MPTATCPQEGSEDSGQPPLPRLPAPTPPCAALLRAACCAQPDPPASLPVWPPDVLSVRLVGPVGIVSLRISIFRTHRTGGLSGFDAASRGLQSALLFAPGVQRLLPSSAVCPRQLCLTLRPRPTSALPLAASSLDGSDSRAPLDLPRLGTLLRLAVNSRAVPTATRPQWRVTAAGDPELCLALCPGGSLGGASKGALTLERPPPCRCPPSPQPAKRVRRSELRASVRRTTLWSFCVRVAGVDRHVRPLLRRSPQKQSVESPTSGSSSLS